MPINRLPSEILVSIFQAVVNSAYPRVIFNSAYPRDIFDCASYVNPAAKLAQVCLYWRQLALEARSLWSCIIFPYQSGKQYERVSTTARVQLERTRGSPIDLFLFHEPYYFLDVSQLQSTLDLINPYMKQLRSLTVRLHRSEHIESLLACCLTNGTAGSLSRLEISKDTASHPLFFQAHSQIHKQLDEYLQSVRVLKLRDTKFGLKSAVFDHLDELVLQGTAIVHDPEVSKVKEWKNKLQRAFLNKTPPAPEIISPTRKSENLATAGPAVASSVELNSANSDETKNKDKRGWWDGGWLDSGAEWGVPVEGLG
ncbi:hypothetical protein BDV93DRAFT_511306 [Ceratobasidium sp. AG-I]|nr:hypothetical protein BDV93DRAFT_511306 [Ceratobasidium sp. AG-I]